ncbi:hypothetical protein GCM10009641_40390 [Mycobacterium cookii]|uniref:Uncharacterized protein n=1 Tax=Mycobacterium cookii TaxID=1775 RepID=A0A7I7KZ99_9MYCO|nr:hypothetical protein MCOO_28230 [Mycobacterium cookii]
MVVSVHRESPLTTMPEPPPSGTRSSALAGAADRPAETTVTMAAETHRSQRFKVGNAIPPSADGHTPKWRRQSSLTSAQWGRSSNEVVGVELASSGIGLHGNMNRTIKIRPGGRL